jgi:hypothetical protein
MSRVADPALARTVRRMRADRRLGLRQPRSIMPRPLRIYPGWIGPKLPSLTRADDMHSSRR